MGRFIGIAIVVLLGAHNALGQTLQSQTTWGSAGAEFSGGVAIAPNGNVYLTGTTDGFAVDEFGNPEARIFLLRFTSNGSLTSQQIWNGQSTHGKTAVAIAGLDRCMWPATRRATMETPRS
jgi:hypothetical protein